nr:MAG TPA: hypothetical protein [Caudoviricetes sp.]
MLLQSEGTRILAFKRKQQVVFSGPQMLLSA